MKKLLAILFLLCPLFCQAQKEFKFKMLNAVTGDPMAGKWCTVLKNADEYVDMVHTNAEGVGTFMVRKYDSTATYQIEIGNRANNFVKPGLFDITGIKNSEPVIKVYPSKISAYFTCGEVLYSSYHPLEPYSMNDLPISIQQKTRALLTKRVGYSFYKKLILNGGQIVDLEKFYSRNPKAKENRWVPPTYSLCFMVWDSIRHTNTYNFTLKLNQEGKLMGLIDLPDIKHDASKAKIISIEEAKKIAAENNFNNTNANAYYYPKAGSIVWELEDYKKDEGEYTTITKLLIDAHTGGIIDKVTTKAIVME